MNYMKEVAQLLGVEIGEEFKVDLDGVVYRKNFYFTESSLFVVGDDEPEVGVLNYLLNGNYKVIKLPKYILDYKEREYLTIALKPFRESIVHIFKTDFHVKDGLEYLRIHVHDALDGAYYDISLPCFKKNTMYKNMELGKRYTLEELGL